MKAFFLIIFFATAILLASCYTSRNSDSDPNNDRSLIGFGKSVSRRKRHLATYPPSEFTRNLFNYHKRNKHWPESWDAWASNSFEGWKKATEMLNTNYDELKIAYSSKDTLLISYVFNPAKTKDDDGRTDIFIDKKYRGTYIYTVIDSNYFVENKVKKRGR